MYFFDLEDYCVTGFIGLNSVDFSLDGDWTDLPLQFYTDTKNALKVAIDNWYIASTSGRITPICTECDTIKTQLDNSFSGDTRIIDFWDNATNNNMVDLTKQQFDDYNQAIFEQMCLLKQLINCIDGSTFVDYTP